MKIFKDTAPIEVALQKVEDVLRSEGITIEHAYNGLSITYKGKEYLTYDTDSGGHTGVLSFPRSCDGERIVAESD